MTIDPRWIPIAREWLIDADIPDRLVDKYAADLAQQLHDRAEQFLEYDFPEAEEQAEEAARDAHIHRQIDEARGK